MAARKALAKGPVVKAVEHDLKQFGADLAASGLAASALALAGEIDSPLNSATSKSMCARALLDTLERLRALAPPKKEKTKVDDLASKRARRRSASRSAGSARSARP
jgi:hypothetical protein